MATCAQLVQHTQSSSAAKFCMHHKRLVEYKHETPGCCVQASAPAVLEAVQHLQRERLAPEGHDAAQRVAAQAAERLAIRRRHHVQQLRPPCTPCALFHAGPCEFM